MKFLIAIFLLCAGAALALPTKFYNDAGRVVGGEEVERHSRPFQVACIIHTSQGAMLCGGSLISDHCVLTAAHCVDIAEATHFELLFGAHNIFDNTEPNRVSVSAPVSAAIVHPGWNKATLQNDVALIRLPDPVTLNENVQTIDLPMSLVGNDLVGEEATVSGWGKYDDNIQSVSPVLNKVTKNVTTQSECNNSYPGMIKPTHICTEGSNAQSACSGDSGGPLTVVDTDDGEPILVGVVSFGYAGGCEEGWPVAYSRVTEYLSWICENSNADCTV